eukprot:scaffold8001_cov125-Isochrysis_galbana.AAC.11
MASALSRRSVAGALPPQRWADVLGQTGRGAEQAAERTQRRARRAAGVTALWRCPPEDLHAR